jgi:hypothetical protein
VTFSLLITRVATVIVTATGMSRQAARFQARAAFIGAGFTTSESAQVVDQQRSDGEHAGSSRSSARNTQ